MRKFFQNRYNLMILLLAICGVLFAYRLFDLQLVNGASYREISDDRLSGSMPIKAPRGEILDRYGRALVTNRLGLSVAIKKTDDDPQKINRTLLALTELFDAESIETKDTLPISWEEPYRFVFEAENEEDQAQKEADWKRDNNYKAATTAEGVIDRYVKKYEMDPSYTQPQIRRLAGIRYDMEARSFSSSNPYVFATDLDVNLVTKIKEQSDRFPAAAIYTEPIREFVNGSLAAHILGRVGIINAEEYAQLKEKNYGINDYLGKEGVEKAFESYLKGTDGVNSIERTVNNGQTRLIYSKDPVPGNSVMLTIDLDLQRAAEESLARHVQAIGGADSGAVVVLDVNSAEILATASYPTYNPATFNADYTELAQDPAKPMINRAIGGRYEPGSTYKILTAIAGLESGALRPNELIETKGVMHYYGQDFTCLAYQNGRGNHGTINVSKALEVSCNYFFYEVGRRTEIETLDEYARQFGLGEYTGIELDELKGMLAGPESREQNGGVWYPGDTLQAAIGQSDNLFTPLQLANYIATVANGGTRYEAHLLKAIKSNTEQRLIEEKEPAVAAQIALKPENREAVVEGMLDVSSAGTASATFDKYPVKVAAKTGTAEVSRGNDNAVFVAFAPYDDPQIAIAVVVEHGAHGSDIAIIARDVFDEYFLKEATNQQPVTPTNRLLP